MNSQLNRLEPVELPPPRLPYRVLYADSVDGSAHFVV